MAKNQDKTGESKVAEQDGLERTPLRERLRDLQLRLSKYPRTGLNADKAFYDDLCGDP